MEKGYILKEEELLRLIHEAYELGLSRLFPHNFKVWKEQELEQLKLRRIK